MQDKSWPAQQMDRALLMLLCREQRSIPPKACTRTSSCVTMARTVHWLMGLWPTMVWPSVLRTPFLAMGAQVGSWRTPRHGQAHPMAAASKSQNQRVKLERSDKCGFQISSLGKSRLRLQQRKGRLEASYKASKAKKCFYQSLFRELLWRECYTCIKFTGAENADQRDLELSFFCTDTAFSSLTAESSDRCALMSRQLSARIRSGVAYAKELLCLSLSICFWPYNPQHNNFLECSGSQSQALDFFMLPSAAYSAFGWSCHRNAHQSLTIVCTGQFWSGSVHELSLNVLFS